MMSLRNQKHKGEGARLRVLYCETEASQVAPDRETNQTVPQSTHSQSEGSETQTQEVAETVTGDRRSPQTTDFREDSAEVDDAGITDDVLAVGEESYDEVEGEHEQGDGAVDVGAVTLEETLEKPMNESRKELVKAISEDHSLDSLKKLADMEANGYKWEDGLLMKFQLDPFGKPSKGLCVPKRFREKCMVLVHDRFGHRGKNKVAQDLAPIVLLAQFMEGLGDSLQGVQNLPRVQQKLDLDILPW